MGFKELSCLPKYCCALLFKCFFWFCLSVCLFVFCQLNLVAIGISLHWMQSVTVVTCFKKLGANSEDLTLSDFSSYDTGIDSRSMLQN